jgi:ADP-heptose:LPS heptosyltransferase
VLITSTAGDSDKITAGLSQLAGEESIVNLAGQFSLAELGELMSQAELVISGDSFPMHLATAVGVPLLTLFGPTDELKTGPRSANSLVLRPAECQRCDKRDCARACLGQITVLQVESAAMSLLS